MPGFKVQVISNKCEDLNPFICVSCNLLLKEPYQLNDGSRICSSCLNSNDENSRKIDKKDCFFDKFAWNYIKTLKVYCEKRKDGCDWSGTIAELEGHLEVCEVGRVKTRTEMSGDEEPPSIKTKPLDEGNTYDMSVHVQNNGFKKDINANAYVSIVQCDNCSEVLPTDQLNNHYKIWCDQKKKVCPFNEEGCQQKEIMNKTEISEHIKLNIVTHLLLLLTQIRNIRFSYESLKTTIASFRNEIFERTNQIGSFASEIKSEFIKWTDYVTSQFNKIWDKIEHVLKEVADIRKALVLFNGKHHENEKRISELESGLFTQQTQIGEQMKDLESMHKNIEKYRDQIAALRGAYYELKSSQNKEKDEKPSTGLPAPVFPPEDSPDYITSYDGVLLWKISDVMKKREDAIMKRTPSIISPPFYTNARGYKLCARLYMNGDGVAKGRYLSLFFAVMKSPFDAVLSWPFKGKVAMTLIDQENVKHHEESFYADVSSSSFQRPKNEINIASGSPKFFSLDALDTHGYVRDDTMFIKITVTDR